jgi:two-component system response regulator WspF
MRIAIVNDNRLAVEVLSRVVGRLPGATVAWIAGNGLQAVASCLGDRPDLVLMDLVMPVMDGAEATRRIMAESPCGILLVTATVFGNAGLVFEALSHGAVDVVATPCVGLHGDLEGADEVIRKIQALARILSLKIERPVSSPVHRTPPWIAMGASTGGPRAIASILRDLPADLKAIVAVVQHLNAAYVSSLAAWLTDSSTLPVRVAETGERPQPGIVYIAGGDDHLRLNSNGVFDLNSQPLDHPHRPSIDEFFCSLARCQAEYGTAVLLTGMGSDGAAGLGELRKSGWHTIAQDQKSSVVFGMAKAAIELGAADEVLPLDRITSAILARQELR